MPKTSSSPRSKIRPATATSPSVRLYDSADRACRSHPVAQHAKIRAKLCEGNFCPGRAQVRFFRDNDRAGHLAVIIFGTARARSTRRHSWNHVGNGFMHVTRTSAAGGEESSPYVSAGCACKRRQSRRDGGKGENASERSCKCSETRGPSTRAGAPSLSITIIRFRTYAQRTTFSRDPIRPVHVLEPR